MAELAEHELVKAVFNNDKGDQLLAMWSEIYMDRPSYVPGNPVEDSIYFEGQRSMILAIKQLQALKPPKIKEI